MKGCFQVHSIHQDLGAVYILTIVLIFSLLSLSAWVIDWSIALASHEQQRHSCQYAALAALSGYVELDPLLPENYEELPVEDQQNANYQERLKNALLRANQIASLNSMLGRQMPEDGDVTPFDEINLDTTSVPDFDVSGFLNANFGYTSANGGTLVPGQWVPGDHCPPEYPENRPCFRANIMGDQSVSSFRCDARLDNPIRTLVGRMIGVENMRIQAFAAAAYKPKQLEVVLDLSSSIAHVTHVEEDPPTDPELRYTMGLCNSWDDNGTPFNSSDDLPYHLPDFGTRSYYAYRWPLDFDDPNDPIVSSWQRLQISDNTLIPLLCEPDFGQSSNPVPEELWRPGNRVDLALSPYNMPQGDPRPEQHYWSDYRMYRFGNANCNQASPEGRHPVFPGIPPIQIPLPGGLESYTPARACLMIDQYRDATHLGPEPLQTLLTGISVAIDVFEERNSGADLLGLMAFDEYIFPLDQTPTGEQHRMRRFPLDLPALLREAVTVDPMNPDATIRSMLFPISDAGTNILLALQESVAEFENAPGGAEQVIVLMSDGVHNCYHTNGNWDEQCDDPRRAGEELRAYIGTLAGSGVKVYVMMIREKLEGPYDQGQEPTDSTERAPHTKNIQRDEYSACCSSQGADPTAVEICDEACAHVPRWMEYEEAMSAGLEFVQPVFYGNNTTYQGPNDLLYDVADSTHGGWMPLRPPPPDQAQCCLDLGAQKIATCAGPTTNNVGVPIPNTPPLPRTAGTLQYYDPFCRSEAEQVEAYMEKIVRKSEFVLVQ